MNWPTVSVCFCRFMYVERGKNNWIIYFLNDSSSSWLMRLNQARILFASLLESFHQFDDNNYQNRRNRCCFGWMRMSIVIRNWEKLHSFFGNQSNFVRMLWNFFKIQFDKNCKGNKFHWDYPLVCCCYHYLRKEFIH